MEIGETEIAQSKLNRISCAGEGLFSSSHGCNLYSNNWALVLSRCQKMSVTPLLRNSLVVL